MEQHSGCWHCDRHPHLISGPPHTSSPKSSVLTRHSGHPQSTCFSQKRDTTKNSEASRRLPPLLCPHCHHDPHRPWKAIFLKATPGNLGLQWQQNTNEGLRHCCCCSLLSAQRLSCQTAEYQLNWARAIIYPSARSPAPLSAQRGLASLPLSTDGGGRGYSREPVHRPCSNQRRESEVREGGTECGSFIGSLGSYANFMDP